MSGTKISDLTAATTLAASDQFEINAAGTSKSATAQKIADFIASVSQTLTQKTFDTAGSGNSFKINGTAITAVTGTGSVVLAAAPTITGLSRLNGNLGINTNAATQYTINIGTNLTGSTAAYGIANVPTVASDVTASYIGNYAAGSTQAAAFTLTNARQFQANGITIGSGSAITNQYGFFANSNLNTATNNYGFYGGLAAATGSYNLYMAGTADNYLAGALGIGTAPAAGYKHRVGGSISGATSVFGIAADPAIQSSVTSAYYGVYSAGSTAAASFTLNSVRHFQTNGITIGSGSAITNQYGFLVESSMTTATANYGFYGALASASGVYNLYMAGTAANYFGGATTFNAALTYGGVTLSNSVTGTGSMVLSTAPTLDQLVSLSQGGVTVGGLGGDANGSVRIGPSTGGSGTKAPYLDFRTGAANYDARLQATAANTLNLYLNNGSINPQTWTTTGTTISLALTYGGVTLSNSVTGTGSMVLSASPTFTGTVTTAGLTVGSGSALKLGNAYVSGAPSATGYVTIQDSAGTTYKVLVAT